MATVIVIALTSLVGFLVPLQPAGAQSADEGTSRFGQVIDFPDTDESNQMDPHWANCP